MPIPLDPITMAKKINCNVSSHIKATIKFETIGCIEKVSGNKNIIVEETFSPETSFGSKFPVSLQIFKEINRPGSEYKVQVRILGVYSAKNFEIKDLKFRNAKKQYIETYGVDGFRATHPGSCTFEATIRGVVYKSEEFANFTFAQALAFGTLEFSFSQDSNKVLRGLFGLKQEFSQMKYQSEPPNFKMICYGESNKKAKKTPLATFEFHKSFLAISDPLRNMIGNGNFVESKKDEVNILDFSPSTIKTFHDLIYDKEIKNIDEAFNTQLLKFADKYDIQPLYKVCLSVILDTLNMDSILDVIITAHEMNDEKLFNAAVEFGKKHPSKLDMTQEWQDFMNKFPDVYQKWSKKVLFIENNGNLINSGC